MGRRVTNHNSLENKEEFRILSIKDSRVKRITAEQKIRNYIKSIKTLCDKFVGFFTKAKRNKESLQILVLGIDCC